MASLSKIALTAVREVTLDHCLLMTTYLLGWLSVGVLSVGGKNIDALLLLLMVLYAAACVGI